MTPVIAPFQGLRYHERKVELSKVVAPPYDVISAELQKSLYARDPYNVVRLILGKQSSSDSETDNRYTRAGEDLETWVRAGILLTDPEPSFYLYEQRFSLKDGRSFTRRGFLALRRLEAFQGGKIRPHERTLSGPKADRLLLMKSCQANLSPIFALYSDCEGLMKDILDPHFEKAPLLDIQDDEGVRHRLWKVVDPGLFKTTDEVVGNKILFIADGHHRYETAIAYRNWVQKQNGPVAEDSPLHYVMMFFSEMSDPGLVILPTHRIVQNRPGFDAAVFRKKLEGLFSLQEVQKEPAALVQALKKADALSTSFGLILAGDPRCYVISPKDKKKLSPVDTAVLHQTIFHGLMGLGDEEERDPKYLRFVKNTEEVFEASREAGFHCGFLLKAPPMEVLRQVVEAGDILPPKTTYFYPKLLSGLVLRQIDRAGRVTI